MRILSQYPVRKLIIPTVVAGAVLLLLAGWYAAFRPAPVVTDRQPASVKDPAPAGTSAASSQRLDAEAARKEMEAGRKKTERILERLRLLGGGHLRRGGGKISKEDAASFLAAARKEGIHDSYIAHFVETSLLEEHPAISLYLYTQVLPPLDLSMAQNRLIPKLAAEDPAKAMEVLMVLPPGRQLNQGMDSLIETIGKSKEFARIIGPLSAGLNDEDKKAFDRQLSGRLQVWSSGSNLDARLLDQILNQKDIGPKARLTALNLSWSSPQEPPSVQKLERLIGIQGFPIDEHFTRSALSDLLERGVGGDALLEFAGRYPEAAAITLAGLLEEPGVDNSQIPGFSSMLSSLAPERVGEVMPHLARRVAEAGDGGDVLIAAVPPAMRDDLLVRVARLHEAQGRTEKAEEAVGRIADPSKRASVKLKSR